MLAGVVICTYSAIFVSTPVLIYLGLMLSGVKAQARPTTRVPQAAE
jgi:preprotein translocase subunit SecF